MTDITFITGNQHKADYLAQMLGLTLKHHKVDLDEIQSTSLEAIVEHKVRQAYDILGKPVIVEDVALGFDAMNGLPGPFVKFYVEQPEGLEKMCRSLDGFAARGAVAACVFGYYDGSRLELLRGELHGVIAEHPRGANGFGWDAIFCPDGFGGQTRAEMTPTDDAATYATIKPFAALRELLAQL